MYAVCRLMHDYVNACLHAFPREFIYILYLSASYYKTV